MYGRQYWDTITSSQIGDNDHLDMKNKYRSKNEDVLNIIIQKS
jgi:hypothetical protein